MTIEICRVRDLGIEQFTSKLYSGIGLQIGPFPARITAHLPSMAGPLFELYGDYEQLLDDAVYSFHVRIEARRSVPLVGKSLVRFVVDGQRPHEDMPASQSLAVLEWGINLVVALRSHCYLMLHSAVIEKDGIAMLLPAAPASGKTTLCAGMALSGWRLFSDEFGLIRPGSDRAIPIPRPLALKNESISMIRQYADDVVIGPEIPNTRKGTVAHMKPPAESITRSGESAPVRWIVFPRWQPGARTTLTEISRGEAFMFLATNAFNYELIGEPAFHTLVGLVEQSRCFHFEYSELDVAVAALTDFVSRDDT